MAEPMPTTGPFDHVEAMVRAAGGYVHASGDLRPRVLETARMERRSRRAKRWIVGAAAAVVALAVTFAALLARQPRPSSNQPAEYVRAGMAGGGASTWRLVDLFTSLREKQAEAIAPSAAE